MAKLEVVHRTEVEMVFVATPVKKYVLELSQDEAEVLAGLLYRVGGRPEGPRGKLQQVFSALESAGVAPREMTINNTRFAACMVS